MKNKLLIIILVVIICIGGYFIMDHFKKKYLIDEAQKKAEEYVVENYQDIESVQVSTDNYKFKPMGTIGIGGRINNKDELYFYATFLIKNNEVGELRTIVEAHDFPDRKDGE